MTPAQIDAVTDGLIGLRDTAATFGPGLGVAAGLWADWWTNRRIGDAIQRRRAMPRSIRQLESYANHPANRTRKEDRP